MKRRKILSKRKHPKQVPGSVMAEVLQADQLPLHMTRLELVELAGELVAQHFTELAQQSGERQITLRPLADRAEVPS